MRTVTTTEAKATLNGPLAEVAAGETITITNRGRAVAVLSPSTPAGRTVGRYADRVTLTDDFDAPLDDAELRLWGESA